ncbi:Protein KUP-1 [Aphelenchoides avenae]|nr:Protein KUP-1 [Aphelenchus avenae]
MDATYEEELDWDDAERDEAVQASNEPPPQKAAEGPSSDVTEESSTQQTRKRPLSQEAEPASAGSGDEDNNDGEQTGSASKSRLAGRVTRLKAVPRRNIDPKRFGIEPKKLKEITVTNEDIEAVYKTLGVDADDSSVRLHSLFIKGVDGMNPYDIAKIFAEYGKPESVRLVDEASCIIRWNNAAEAAQVSSSKLLWQTGSMFQILFDMTRPLLRVRSAKVPEEGELSGSEEEEEGQVKEENGDDVAVVQSAQRRRKKRLDSLEVVEIDVDTVKVPPGKWRVIVRHVPESRLLLARIATGYEVRLAVTGTAIRLSAEQKQAADSKRGRFDDDGFEYKWSVQQDKVRAGLNVFDEKGQELDWDYEHDTRFYDKDSSGEDEDKPKESDAKQHEVAVESPGPVETTVGGRQIRSRGRGTKKFFAFASKSSDEDSDAA